jgi:general secretion pathway protein D
MLVVLAATLACAAGNAFRKGDAAMKAGDLDQAVAYFRSAVQAAPDNPNYKIALERASQAAARAHMDKAKDFEQKDQLEAALGEYRLVAEYEPGNRVAVAKVAQIERTIRERIEASRPKPPIQEMRERIRAASEPVLNPSSRTPLRFNFQNTNVKEILNFVASASGINISYDREVQDRPTSVQLDGVTLEQALNQIMTANGLSYKIVNERSILVFPDTTPKHMQYDDQVIKTIYLSNADPQEMVQILSAVSRIAGMAIQPIIYPNKSSNSVTIRGTTQMVQILEKIIEQNDKPRAEIVVDVEILEVDRSRAKQYGLNLTDYSVGTIFSPEVNPTGAATTTTPTTGGTTGTTPGVTATPVTGAPSSTSRAPSSVTSGPLFNLNTISRGVSTADFYLAVPAAIVRFLESDNRTRIIAKPQLRGAEGQKLTLNLGQSIPVISTAYTPLATGGVGVNPLSSYNYKDVGVNIDMTPRVTLEGDIVLDLTLDDSARGSDITVAGVSVPSFVQRKVTTRLRLRDGESNLLAGLLQQTETTKVQGFPGAIHLPFFRQLFSANDNSSDQVDIVMLLTPHVVRTQEITEENLKPIYIGSQGAAGAGLAVGGPPPLIAPVPEQAAAQPGTRPVAATAGTTAVVTVPPGSTPVPGTVLVTPPAPTTPPVTPPAEAPAPVTPPATQPPPAAQPPAVASPPTETPTTSPGIGSATVLLSPPGTTFRVGGGPYTVPISITGATRLSTITLTLTFDPALLRVRSIQEGSFMRTGGASATFNQQVGNGRVDITISRGADALGATGTGVLAVVLFDAVAPGSVSLVPSGAGTGPGGTAMGLQFRPVTITVQQ